MKLTDSQRQSLYDLSVATARPDTDTPRLVQLGLAEQGKGRYGEYVRITAKGMALARSWSNEDQLALMTRNVNQGLMPADRSAVTTSRFPPRRRDKFGSAGTQTPTKSPGNSTSPPGRELVPPCSAAGCREAPNAPATSAPSTSTLSRSRKLGPRPSAELPARKSSHSSSEAAPNALRVLNSKGTRAAYYPLSFTGLKDGTYERVFTRNKLFATVSMAASGGDDIVCEPDPPR